MAAYQYTAKNSAGKYVRGTMSAASLSELYERLSEEGLYCLSQKEVPQEAVVHKTRYKLKLKDLVLFCRKLSTMLAAGMSITNCLDMMVASESNVKIRQIYLELFESIKGGMSLTASMREQGKAFPMLLINMFESGEESGNLDGMAEKLSSYYEKQARISAKIKTATTYPKLLAGMAFLVVIGLFVFILPGIFESFGNMELPAITRGMMWFSNFLIHRWYICLGIVAAIVVLVQGLMRMKSFQLFWGKFTMSVPIVGRPVRNIYSSRFASTMAILYSSGLSLLNGVRMSVNTIGSPYIEQKLSGVIEGLTTGKPLSVTIAEADVFDKMLPSMIRIGEETGSLDTILLSTSAFYETEAETAIEKILAILEPVLLVTMGIIIGVVMISVMLPIFSSYLSNIG